MSDFPSSEHLCATKNFQLITQRSHIPVAVSLSFILEGAASVSEGEGCARRAKITFVPTFIHRPWTDSRKYVLCSRSSAVQYVHSIDMLDVQ